MLEEKGKISFHFILIMLFSKMKNSLFQYRTSENLETQASNPEKETGRQSLIDGGSKNKIKEVDQIISNVAACIENNEVRNRLSPGPEPNVLSFFSELELFLRPCTVDLKIPLFFIH